ncbi:ABC transporter substrate-binding protein [Pontiella sulfatireligans]|uniref:Vitamin B12-binding protein n=1 Tax=Pontiella sulfatireligans TaxID=2750658 RepID=A0A6C2URP4_9BACT|nr:helical backbone metal receptor [Pontiella sulfatireligans]VGO22809.1 Vitamin B12-binding protein [Pontiella sulfatireligans]
MIKRCTFLLALALLAGCGKPAPRTLDRTPERIISMAPNITETVYALGLGSKLVGATSYCTYPEAARDIPRIGGFGQFNYEAIVSACPDLVILHKEYEAEQERLSSLGIPFLKTGSYFIADILQTIERVGQTCGAEPEADALIQDLQNRMAELKGQPTNRPRVLITFGGSAGGMSQIHAFGTECIHNELLELAGGQNVIEGKLPFSVISKEAVLRLNPDIVIVLAPDLQTPGEVSKQWNTFKGVNAIERSQIHILTGSYTCIPGPRFIQTLEDFARVIRQNNFVAE